MSSAVRTARVLGALLTLVSIAAIAVATPQMAQRLSDHFENRGAVRWSVLPEREEIFTHRGEQARLRTIDDDQSPHVLLEWGRSSVRIPITGMQDPRLPELLRHSGWLAALRMAPVDGDLEELLAGLADGSIQPRLIIVARAPAPGYDPETWGQARYKEWRYTFIELLPDGILERSEASYRELNLTPWNWQFVAAMHVTPGLQTAAARSASPLSYPNYGPVRSAIGAMGWTWPVASVGILTLLLGLMLFFGSFVAVGRRPRG